MFAIFSTAAGEHLERYSVFRFNAGKIEYVPISGALYLESHETDIEPIHIRIKTATSNVSTYYWYTGWQVVNNEIFIPVYDFLNTHLIFPEMQRLKCQYDYPDWCMMRVREQKVVYSSVVRMYGYTEEYSIDPVPVLVPAAPVLVPAAPVLVPPAPVLVPAAPVLVAPAPVLVAAAPLLVAPAPPPFAKTALNQEKLPNFVAEALVKSVKDAGADCSISMTPFRTCSKIAVTNCYHCFEAESLERWCKNKMVCPMCKSALKFITVV